MAHYEHRAGSIRAIVSTPGSGRRSATFPTLAEAQAWAATLEVRKARGARLRGGAGVRLADVWDQFIVLRTDPTTARKDESRWRTHVEPMWGRVPVRKITSRALDGWVAGLVREGDLSTSTISGLIYLVSALLRFAESDGLVDSNAVAGMRVKVHPSYSPARLLDEHELGLLLKASQPHYVPLWATIAAGALRFGEAAGRYVRDLDLTPGREGLWVRQTLRRDGTVKATPKGRHGEDDVRFVALPADVVRQLAQLAAGRRHDEFLFTAVQGGPMLYTTAKREWQRMTREAGLTDPQPTIHDLRHSAATYLARLGMPQHELMAVLGQRDPRSLQRYLHAGTDAADRQRLLMDDRMRSIMADAGH